jgi:hypothetical protein
MDKSDKDWLWGLGWGVFCFAGAAFLYWAITEIEASGGTIRMKSIFALLYMIGGKWLLCLPLVISGSFFIAVGIRSLMQRR